MCIKSSLLSYQINKRKIINDPVYGFINIPGEFLFDLIQHPWIQRLRNIRQLGLTSYVYPGAVHTRFQHCLGAMHLMNLALQTLKGKGVEISPEEEEASLAAILLHDAGHGPFSHALEESIVKGITHEDISLLLMKKLNLEFGGRLSLAIEIFTGSYHRRFFHELIAGQADMDRLDYLNRDGFYTGVIEGSVGSDRIISMLNVSGDRLAIEEKGIYSIEKLLVARRFMYWQVYMHKTVISSETLLANLLRRAKELAESGKDLFCTPSLKFFLSNRIGPDDLTGNGLFTPGIVASHFVKLDDSDILVAAKYWCDDSDRVLADLSCRLLSRNLLATEIQDKPVPDRRIKQIKEKLAEKLEVPPGMEDYYVFSGRVLNLAYAPDDKDDLRILLKSGGTAGINELSEMVSRRPVKEPVTRYYLCYPKECV